MHLASTYGHFENVKVLIDTGADINKQIIMECKYQIYFLFD